MNIEQRLELLTAAIVDLNETIREVNGLDAPASEDTNAGKVQSRAEPEQPPEVEAGVEQEAQTAIGGISKDDLQSKCIAQVREKGDFKKQIQAELKQYGVKTISQLPDDKVQVVNDALFGGE